MQVVLTRSRISPSCERRCTGACAHAIFAVGIEAGGSAETFLSVEAPQNGGQGRAPDANTLMSAGIGFCFMTQFGRFVSMLKLDLQDYRIVQDTHFSLGGASGATGKEGEAAPVETHVYLTTTESDDIAREMLDISEQTCFLHAFCRTDLKPKVKNVQGAFG